MARRKDLPGGGNNVPLTAWAETIGPRAVSGFSRAAGFDIPAH